MTIEQGMLICGLVCVIPALWYCRIKRRIIEIGLHFVVPVLVAMAVYWGPFPENWGKGEHHAWAGLFLSVFFLFGMVGSVIGGFMGRIIKNKTKGRSAKR